MKYIVDNDLHIHSQLSDCSKDPLQNKEAILKYAEDNGFTSICLTDHFWDEEVELEDSPWFSGWYQRQNYKHISQALPLPQSDKVKFYFGCETDISKEGILGLAKKNFDKFDFVIISTTHLHMEDLVIYKKDLTDEGRVRVYIEQLDRLLGMDLPFHKVGIAHLTCNLIKMGEWEEHLKILDMIPEEEFRRIFTKAAKCDVGIELNFPISRYTEDQYASALRPYKIAKECGCKFYFGSDAHHPAEFIGAKENFEKIVELLDLTEEDKFHIA